MTLDDLRKVLEAYEAIRSRDLGRMLGLVDDRIEIHTRIESYTGVDGAMQMFRQAFAADFDNDPEGIVVLDDTAVAFTRLRLVGATTGIETAEQLIEAWRFEGGKLVELTVADRTEGLQSLGLGADLAELDLFRSHQTDRELLVKRDDRVVMCSDSGGSLWRVTEDGPLRLASYPDRGEALAALFAM